MTSISEGLLLRDLNNKSKLIAMDGRQHGYVLGPTSDESGVKARQYIFHKLKNGQAINTMQPGYRFLLEQSDKDGNTVVDIIASTGLSVFLEQLKKGTSVEELMKDEILSTVYFPLSDGMEGKLLKITNEFRNAHAPDNKALPRMYVPFNNPSSPWKHGTDLLVLVGSIRDQSTSRFNRASFFPTPFTTVHSYRLGDAVDGNITGVLKPWKVKNVSAGDQTLTYAAPGSIPVQCIDNTDAQSIPSSFSGAYCFLLDHDLYSSFINSGTSIPLYMPLSDLLKTGDRVNGPFILTTDESVTKAVAKAGSLGAGVSTATSSSDCPLPGLCGSATRSGSNASGSGNSAWWYLLPAIAVASVSGGVLLSQQHASKQNPVATDSQDTVLDHSQSSERPRSSSDDENGRTIKSILKSIGI